MLKGFNSSKTNTFVSDNLDVRMDKTQGQQEACPSSYGLAVQPDQLQRAVQLLYKNWRWSPFPHATWKAFQPQLAKDFNLPVMEKGQIIPHPRFLHCPDPHFLLCRPWFPPIESFRKWCQCSHSFFDVIHIHSEANEIEKGSWQSGCQGTRSGVMSHWLKPSISIPVGPNNRSGPCWRQTKPEIKATF